MLHHSVPPKLHQSWNEARSAIKELLGEGDRTHLNELLLELRILLLSNLSSHLVFEFGKSCNRMIQVTSSCFKPNNSSTSPLLHGISLCRSCRPCRRLTAGLQLADVLAVQRWTWHRSCTNRKTTNVGISETNLVI